MADNWRGFRLRKDRPKGIVCGPAPVSSAKYVQGGYYFASTGECLGEGQNPKPEMFGGSKAELVPNNTAPSTPCDKIDANEIYYKDLNTTIMEMSDAGSNATEIHAHLQHNGTEITWQKIASIVRKEKKKRLEGSE